MASRNEPTVRATLSNFIADVEAWAESDADENDGVRLTPEALTSYLQRHGLTEEVAEGMAASLMLTYERQFQAMTRRRNERAIAARAERAEIDVITAQAESVLVLAQIP